MAERENLISVLRSAEPRHWWESISWLMFNLVGGLLPLWGGLTLLYLFDQHQRWHQLISHGEFALYSASLLAPAVFVVVKDGTPASFVHRQAFVLIAFVGLLLSMLVFAGVTIVSEPGNTFLRLNESALFRISVPLFLVSVAVVFLVTLLDIARTGPDIRRLASENQERLREQFEKTDEGG